MSKIKSVMVKKLLLSYLNIKNPKSKKIIKIEDGWNGLGKITIEDKNNKREDVVIAYSEFIHWLIEK